MRKLIATLFLTVALAVGAAPVASAQPVITGGLVNVTIANFLNNNTVTLDRVVNVNAALNLAANVCDTTVAILAADFADGSATCTNGDQVATVTQLQP
jgi:1,4-dihydroxy-2-naphthoyl-CoA synthase